MVDMRIKKSIMASLLISLGVYVLLMNNSIVGAVLFSLGLFTICKLELNLFTGKCGFIHKFSVSELLSILAINLVAGFLVGYIFRFTSASLIVEACNKVNTWDISAGYFIKSFMCGMIMYLAVLLYNNGTYIGILFGVPMFIMCGFQHCIANVIIMGIASTFNFAIILCILGNWSGSIFANWLIYKREF